MKTFKELINELDTETLKSHSKKRLDQSGQAYAAARQASKEANAHPYGSDAARALHKKSYDLDMQAYKLRNKGWKSAGKAIKKKYPNGNPANDTRGYDQPNRYHGD
jgi:hypothetical protein